MKVTTHEPTKREALALHMTTNTLAMIGNAATFAPIVENLANAFQAEWNAKRGKVAWNELQDLYGACHVYTAFYVALWHIAHDTKDKAEVYLYAGDSLGAMDDQGMIVLGNMATHPHTRTAFCYCIEVMNTCIK